MTSRPLIIPLIFVLNNLSISINSNQERFKTHETFSLHATKMPQHSRGSRVKSFPHPDLGREKMFEKNRHGALGQTPPGQKDFFVFIYLKANDKSN